jgi:hypothetical protein
MGSLRPKARPTKLHADKAAVLKASARAVAKAERRTPRLVVGVRAGQDRPPSSLHPGVVGVRTPTATPSPPQPSIRWVACLPRPRYGPTRLAIVACWTSLGCRCPVGAGGCRQLRRWAGGLPAGQQRAGGGGGPAQAAAAAHRGQERRPGRRPRRREALTQDHPLAPRRRGDREALRVLLATRRNACVAKVSAINQLKALIVGAPEGCGLSCAGWPPNARSPAAHGSATGPPDRWSTA